MNIGGLLNTKVHNEFTFTLRDSITGKVKQRAKAYNIVLNQFIREWVIDKFADLSPTGRFMFIGKGTGTLSPTRTALFNPITPPIRATPTSLEIDYPNATAIFKAIFPATATYTGVITEVGLAQGCGGLGYKLCTHALIQDSEGNPISINKTDIDILEVEATLFISVSSSEGVQLANDAPVFSGTIVSGSVSMLRSDNRLIRACYYSVENPPRTFCLTPSKALLMSTDSTSTPSGSPSWYIPALRMSIADNGYTIPTTRILSGVGNNLYINRLIMADLAYVDFPNAALFPAYLLERTLVGYGDGETTQFNSPIPCFIGETDIVRLGDTVLTRGIDYTIDNMSNDSKNFSAPSVFTSQAKLINYHEADSISGLPMFVGWHMAACTRLFLSNDKPFIFEAEAPMTINYILPPNRILSGLSGFTMWTGALLLETSLDGELYEELATLSYTSGVCSVSEVITDPVSAKYLKISIASGANYLREYNNVDNSFRAYVGYKGTGINFTTPPPSGVTITLQAQVDRPYKTVDYVIDYSGVLNLM